MSVAPGKTAGALEHAERQTLVEHVLRALRETGLGTRKLEVIPGRSRLRSGTYPNESLLCELDDGTTLPLFLKYSRDYRRPFDRHRAGVAYEAEVYRRLLEPFAGSTPRFLGAGEIDVLGVSFLILEELQQILRVSKTPPENLVRAARWIGRFHAAHERAAAHERTAGTPGPASFLTVYDRSYYRQWSRRAHRLTRPLHTEYPALSRICAAFEQQVVPVLVASPPTVIHGEFYPKNILTHGTTIHPIDWESAAAAAGEIDLASLTEGWAPEIAEACARAYREARWPGPAGAPAHFEAALDAARFYFLFRWLGNGPYFATGERGRPRLDALCALAERTGLLEP